MSERQPRVVVIEDHPLVRIWQGMLLEDAGDHVAEIAVPSDFAGFVATGHDSQAIVADFDIGPGMTGLDVAPEIMRRAGAWIPTLILSASFGERSVAAAVACDMPVMFKPVSEEKVLAWVADALGRSSRSASIAGSPH